MLLLALVSGFSAWGSALYCIHCNLQNHAKPTLPAISGILCSLSLLCALWQVKHWVDADDVAAILDCANGLLFGGTFLSFVEGVLLLCASRTGKNSM